MAVYFCAYEFNQKNGALFKDSFVLEVEYSNSDNGHVLAFKQCKDRAEKSRRVQDGFITINSFYRV